MKPLLTTLLFITALVSVFVVPVEVAAVDPPEYTLLAPLPGLENVSDVDDTGSLLGEYLLTLYRIVISLVILLAVGAFIFGGLQYMTSVSSDKKSGGRKVIENAIIAILLATGSYLLLFLIGGQESIRLDFDMREIGRVELPGGGGGQRPPGTTEECFNSSKQALSRYEEYISCDPGGSLNPNQQTDEYGFYPPQNIEFKLGDVDYTTNDKCWQVLPETVEYKAQIECQALGGELLSLPDPHKNNSNSLYCISTNNPEIEATCNEILNSEENNPEAFCIEDISRNPVFQEKEAVCKSSQLEIIGEIFTRDELERAVRGSSPICSGQNIDFVIEEATESCEDSGGSLVQEDGKYMCVIENLQCEEELAASNTISSPFQGCTAVSTDYDRGQPRVTQTWETPSVYRNHKGIDFTASQRGFGKERDPIYPVFEGVVAGVGDINYGSKTAGNFIIIRHNLNGRVFYSYYMHLYDDPRKLGLSVGDTVRTDTQIGQVGNTGRSETPHLHLEFRTENMFRGNDIDPIDFFGGDISEMRNRLSGCTHY